MLRPVKTEKGMNEILERIERETIPEIERAVGRKALITAKTDGLIRFRIASEENLDDTKGAGKWREFIYGKAFRAGAAETRISPIVSPVGPDSFTLYSVTVFAAEEAFAPQDADRTT